MDAITRNVIKATQVEIKNECKHINVRLNNKNNEIAELNKNVKISNTRNTILLSSIIVLQIIIEVFRRTVEWI